MGIPKKNFITIDIVRDDQKLPEEFNTAESTVTALKEFYKKQNPDYKGDPYVNLYDHEAYENYVQFEMYSDRAQNLDWQVDLLREYLDSTGLEYDITEDAWIQAD